MILNSIILSVITILILFLSEIFNKKIGRKLFPIHYKKIEEIDKRLFELRNLIRLTLIHNDKKTYEKLQKEYSELYNKVLWTKILVNSIFLIPIILFTVIVNIFFWKWDLFLPPVNMIIFVLGFYFLVKFIISVLRNYFGK